VSGIDPAEDGKEGVRSVTTEIEIIGEKRTMPAKSITKAELRDYCRACDGQRRWSNIAWMLSALALACIWDILERVGGAGGGAGSWIFLGVSLLGVVYSGAEARRLGKNGVSRFRALFQVCRIS